MRFLSLIVLGLAVAHVLGRKSGNTGTNTKPELKKHQKKTGVNCNAESASGNVGLESRGKGGEVVFYRMNHKKSKRGRFISVRPKELCEYDMAGVKQGCAAGLDSGTSVTWDCNVGTENYQDEAGVAQTVNFLQSKWSGTRTIKPGTATVGLEWVVKLFLDQYDLIVCQRKYNRTRIVPRGTTVGANCSVVTTLPGIKWEFDINNWPYKLATNYLKLKVKIGGNKHHGTLKAGNKAGKHKHGRRQWPRKIIEFGEGYLDNPEEVEVSCDDGNGGTVETTETVEITTKTSGKSSQFEIEYKFKPTGQNCLLAYDPVMTDGINGTGTTNGVRRLSALFGLVLAGLAVLGFV